MTEFTKEYIRSVRMCSYLIEPPASEVIEHLCDEIERLQVEKVYFEELADKWSKQYYKDCDQLKAENERLWIGFGLLKNWTEAYPLEVFPEPDLKLARKLLEDGGVNYSALNVYAMRHVINGVKRIIDEALKEVKE